MIAISTAYKEALIGIDIDGITNFKCLESNCKHSENILYSIDKMLDEINKSIKENDFYAVVVGPGSFTGIRIGISLVKGLLAGMDGKNLATITTFELMAYSYIKNFAPQKDFICIINGLSGYYFICKYSCNGEKLSEEKMITKEELAKIKLTTIGLEEEGLGDYRIVPTAQELLCLAQDKVGRGEVVNSCQVVPLYLRKSQAESMLDD